MERHVERRQLQLQLSHRIGLIGEGWCFDHQYAPEPDEQSVWSTEVTSYEFIQYFARTVWIDIQEHLVELFGEKSQLQIW